MKARARLPRICVVLVAYAAVQCAIVVFLANGPFVDEAIYSAAGLRALKGYAVSDGYFQWFNGSPLVWPVFAAIGYQSAGLTGARLLAIAASTLTLWAIWQAATGLFGESVGWWSAVAMGMNGYFIALGHMAVHDGLALTGLALTMVLFVNYSITIERRQLWLAASCFALAVVTKYAFVAMVPALSIVLIAMMHRRRGRSPWVDSLTFVVLTAIAIGAYYLMFRHELAANPLTRFTSHAGTYERPKIFYTAFYAVVAPLVLAGFGAYEVSRRHRGALALSLYWPLIVWPIFHVVTVNIVSLSKQAVMGMIMPAPLVGVCFDWLWRRRNAWLAAAVTTAMAAVGGTQWYVLEHSWESMQLATAYLRARYAPGDRLVVAINSWSFGLDFYTSKVVDNPGFPTNQYRLAQAGDAAAVCANKWLVQDGYARLITPLLQEAIERCPYQLAFEYPSTTYAVTDSGRWAAFPHQVSVYVRSEPPPRPDR